MENLPPVRVLDPYTGGEVELRPLRVWTLEYVERFLFIKRRRTIKVGLFQSPSTGKYFRVRLPDDYTYGTKGAEH